MEERQVTIDKYGNAILSVPEARQALLYDHDIFSSFINDKNEVELFNTYSEKILGKAYHINNPLTPEELTLSPEGYYQNKTSRWNIPDKYKSIDIRQLLLSKCTTSEEINRVQLEYKMFEERNLIPLLQFLVYLVEHMRDKNIVWGVGRGSSVASYCLYLLGVHKVNSIKYDLPIEEFLK